MVGIIFVVGFVWWFVGGIHLDEISYKAPERLAEFPFENCIRDGYKREITGTFGGRVYFTCRESNGIYYTVSFGRRINSGELQMYGPVQKTTFPSNLNINQ